MSTNDEARKAFEQACAEGRLNLPLAYYDCYLAAWQERGKRDVEAVTSKRLELKTREDRMSAGYSGYNNALDAAVTAIAALDGEGSE